MARDGWDRLAERAGVSLTALLEVLGEGYAQMSDDELDRHLRPMRDEVQRARGLDRERRQRKPS